MGKKIQRAKPSFIGVRNAMIGLSIRNSQYWYIQLPAALGGPGLVEDEFRRRFKKIYAISPWKGLRYLITRGKLVRKVRIERLSLIRYFFVKI